MNFNAIANNGLLRIGAAFTALFSQNRTVFVNPDGTILGWTRQLEKDSGLSSGSVTGKRFDEIFRSGSPETIHALLKRAASKGSAYVFRSVKGASGRYQRSAIIISTVYSDSKEILGYSVQCYPRLYVGLTIQTAAI